MEERNAERADVKEQHVLIRTVDGKAIRGLMNIIGFNRVSDYLKGHQEDYLLLYNAGTDRNKTVFLFKENIIMVEESDDTKKTEDDNKPVEVF